MLRNKKEVMTVKEFAEATGLGVSTVRFLIKQNTLISMRVGQRFYINYPMSVKRMWGISK